MDSAQLGLPIPFMTVLVAAALIIRVVTSPAGNASSRFRFALLFAVLGCQAALVGLRFGYGLDMVAPLQRVLPFAVGPLAYLSFRALTGEPSRRDFLRHGLPALTLAILCSGPLILAVAMRPPAILATLTHLAVDVLIAASYLFYAWLLSRLYRRGVDVFEDVDFADAVQSRRWLAAAICFLVVVAVIDTVIALDFSLYDGRQVTVLIGSASLLAIAASLVMLVLYPRQAATGARTNGANEGATATDKQADLDLLDTLRALMAEKQLYRDPDLTLSRLGRRLGVPARRISEAVNRQLGLNVSQYVNEFRVNHAATTLAETDLPVADIMLDSGFRTKSNFNREFRRVTAMSPAEHRGGSGAAAPSTPA